MAVGEDAPPVEEAPESGTAEESADGASHGTPDEKGTVSDGQPVDVDADAASFRDFVLRPEFAQWISSAGLDWTRVGLDWKAAQAAADAGKQQALREFELEREKLRNQAEQAQADVARGNQVHAAELEKIRLASKLRYQNDRVRSTVLLLVVLALVLMPVLAMFSPAPRIAPEEFTQYIAPIVGIAGTVLGYWFGKQETSR